MPRSSSSTNEDLCIPFKNLEELKNWNPVVKTRHFSEVLRKRIYVKSAPKTLLCHDMKGGYLEDSFLNGVKTDECYFFIHWSVIDVFVYFSHNFITIPPCGWISAAHKNGTKILGTLITEWDDGFKLCEEFLADEQSVQVLSAKLVHIAVFYNFDGWLINIENKLLPHQIPLMEKFVGFLTKKMHSEKHDSLVIWYDSVTVTGELKWQNALNENNRLFFDECDGIFLNYNWKDEHLKKSVTEAGPRKTDVYVGVDVFGRGCLGGGGFSSNVAVNAARDFGLSVAIFAPGWVYECLDTKDFTENQYKFWDSLEHLCAPRTIKSLPYSSSFCPGVGKRMYRKGKVISSDPWFNIGLQAPQPTFHHTQCTPPEGFISICTDDAYNGGGCLKLSVEPLNNENFQFELLSTHFVLKGNCIVNYTFKTLSDHTDLTLHLSMHSVQRSYVINLMHSDFHHLQECNSKSILSINEYPTTGSELLIPAHQKHMQLLENENGWITRSFVLKSSIYFNEVIEKISARISCGSGTDKRIAVLLGQIEILPVDTENTLSVTNFDIVKPIKDYLDIRCTLEWGHLSFVHSWDLYYKFGGTEKYIGTSNQTFYNIKDLILDLHHVNVSPGAMFEIEFVLHPQCNGTNVCNPVSHKFQCHLSKDLF